MYAPRDIVSTTPAQSGPRKAVPHPFRLAHHNIHHNIILIHSYRPGSEPPIEPQAKPEQQTAPGPPHFLRNRASRPDPGMSQPPQRWATMTERRTAHTSGVDTTATSQAPGPRSPSPFQDDEMLASRLQRRETVAAERLNREAAVRMQAAMRDQQQEEQLQVRWSSLPFIHALRQLQNVLIH